ncbi:hypothetical protein [Priestia koreensis]|uniref:hypothetical protein n=1 Tax=Priestia koreensis TaxID=284581 RepID=UPI003459C290
MSRNPATVNKEIDDIVKKMAEMRKIQTKHQKEDSIWLEIFGHEEILPGAEDTISIKTSVQRFNSPEDEEGNRYTLPSAGDTFFLFIKPELFCGGKYEVQNVITENKEIQIEIKIIEAFSNPVSIGTLISNSKIPQGLQEQMKLQVESNYSMVKEG